jgi:hypothetical protein
MMIRPPFWLDANVYIECKNRWYRFERFPKFWAFLSAKIHEGSIHSPKAVYDELVEYGDQLSRWVKSRKSGLGIPPVPGVQDRYRKIADYVAKEFPRERAEEFLSDADPWVIASAWFVGGTVVTHESSSRRRKIRIPVVCEHFDIPCTDIVEVIDHFNVVL